MFRFLAECYGSISSPTYQDAALIGFRTGQLHRSGLFEEYKKQQLHLVTTERGSRELGISVDLCYAERSRFWNSTFARGLRVRRPLIMPA
ncbi:hypothetical protein [Methylobacterium nigriterrae]|uniref:hypothetical protein n=1 Tax=Methylobacterium nigriterrae TaxID=3127512 RepID=UPI0030139CDA